MLRIKSKELNKNNKILLFIFLGFFFIASKTSMANEPVDIWKKSENEKTENLEKTITNINDKEKIDFSRINESKEIEIIENQNEESKEIRLVGLYDPQENDLGLDMWSNTDGEIIKNTFK